MPTSPHNGPLDLTSLGADLAVSHASALASGFIYQIGAQAIALSTMNAVNLQQQLNTLSQAVTTMCATELLAADSHAAAPAKTHE